MNLSGFFAILTFRLGSMFFDVRRKTMRKKNRCEKKRIAALILGSVLLFASLSGCGPEAPSKEERSSTSAAEISSGEDMPYDTEGTDDPTENWIVNDETGSPPLLADPYLVFATSLLAPRVLRGGDL